MACVARAVRGSLIYILEMLSLRIEPRNFEDYLYITIFILFFVNHYIVTIILKKILLFVKIMFIIALVYSIQKGVFTYENWKYSKY